VRIVTDEVAESAEVAKSAEGDEGDGGRFFLALTFNHGDRLVGAKSFVTVHDAVEWSSTSGTIDIFDAATWVVVDVADGRTVGSIEDLTRWMPFDEDTQLEEFKELTRVAGEEPPTHFCGGLILFGTWKKVKRRALVGQCEICRKPVVIRFE
jgi:hypothetical protein